MSRPGRWTPQRGRRSASCSDLNEAGQTLVLVTHSPELAARYARRVIRLVNGRIMSDAAAASLP